MQAKAGRTEKRWPLVPPSHSGKLMKLTSNNKYILLKNTLYTISGLQAITPCLTRSNCHTLHRTLLGTSGTWGPARKLTQVPPQNNLRSTPLCQEEEQQESIKNMFDLQGVKEEMMYFGVGQLLKVGTRQTKRHPQVVI